MADRVIAAQLYTVREFMQTPADIASSLRKVKEIGYDEVQLSGHGDIDVRELKKLLDDAGLAVCATHVSFDVLREEPEKVAEEHEVLSCTNIAVGSMPGGYRNKEGYARFAREAEEVGRKLAEKGLVFAYHNHNFELVKYDGETGLDIIFSRTDPAYLKAELDTYWIQAGGGDPAAWIRKLAGRVPFIHIKDMGMSEERTQTFAEIGEGNLNWEEIFRAGRDAGVKWYIVEQDRCAGDPFDSLKKSLENLRAMGYA